MVQILDLTREYTETSAEGTGVVDAAIRVLAACGDRGHPEQDHSGVSWAAQACPGALVPTRDGQRVGLTIDSGADLIATVVIRPSLRIFPGVQEDTDLVLQSTTSGVRVLVVQHGPDAPASVRLLATLAPDHVLEAMPSGGVDIVHPQSGATVGRLKAPRAFDALFAPLATSIHLEQTAVIVEITHRNACHPVVTELLYTSVHHALTTIGKGD